MFKLIKGLCFVNFAKIARRKQLHLVFIQQIDCCLRHELFSCGFVWEKLWLAERSYEENGALHGTDAVARLSERGREENLMDWPVSAEQNQIFAISRLYLLLSNHERTQSGADSKSFFPTTRVFLLIKDRR